MQVQTVNGPNGPIGFATIGQGAPLVLLAGLGATHRLWGDLPAILARRFRVIAIDNRGVGASRAGKPFTIDRALDDLEAVLDVLSVDRAALLGASMGGTLALAAATRRPQRITSVVAASCAAHLSRHGRLSLGLLRSFIAHLPPASVGQALMTLAFSPAFTEQHAEFMAESARLYGLAPEDVAGARAQAEHLLEGWDLRGELAGCTLPVLLLAGRRDPVVAVEDTLAVAAVVPGCETVILDDAAHSVLAEGGEAVFERIFRFSLRHAEGKPPA